MTTEEKLLKLPIVSDWCEYKGEIYYAVINYRETERVGRPMMDLHYCATKALNNIVDKTVQWDKSKFKPCGLTHDKEWKATVKPPATSQTGYPPTRI